jgi:hypothetical protein
MERIALKIKKVLKNGVFKNTGYLILKYGGKL